jgi:hypothetical protein
MKIQEVITTINQMQADGVRYQPRRGECHVAE